MRADYVIVGGGSAGLVLADRLSESGKSTMIVIEAGGETKGAHDADAGGRREARRP